MLRNRIVSLIVFIILLSIFAISGFLELPGAQSVWAQKNTSIGQVAPDGPSTINQTDLTLEKTADPLVYDHTGQIISYSYKVTNTSAVDISGPFTIADDKATDENCPVTATLPAGEFITCTASYEIKQPDMNAGSVTNTATVTNGEITSDAATATVYFAALTLVKSATETYYSAVGNVLHYSYNLTNSGSVALSGPFTITDDKSIDESCPATDTLDPDASITCTATYTIVQGDLTAGLVTNTATGHGYYGAAAVNSSSSSKTVYFAALTLVKSATETYYSAVGNVLHYSYNLTNSGSVALSGPFTITDDKSIDESCPATATLNPGAFITCTATYTILQADLTAGSVTNTATGHGYYSAAAVNSLSSSKTVYFAALTLVKSATETTYNAVGNVLHYSYNLTNSGSVALSGPFTITDDKSTDESCPSTATLNPGAFITCTATYTILQADLNAGSVTNTATGHGYYSAAAVNSLPSSKTVNASQSSSLALVKSATETSYNAVGNVLHYSYNLTNSGNVTLSGPFTITDDKSTNESCPATATLVPGAFITCTATYTILQADLDAGSVTNTASGHGFFGLFQVNSLSSSKTVNATQLPALTITKAADPHIYNQIGQIISYSYQVRNSGNVTLSGPFAVSDNKVTVSCTQPGDGALSPNETMNCTATYTIKRSDLTNGTVTNTAYATGKFGSTPIASDTKSLTITAEHKLTYIFLPSISRPYPDGIHILPNSYSYESHNTVFVIGEVLNNTDNSLSWVGIRVNFYNASDQIVATNLAYMWPLNLPARVRGCFKVSVEKPDEWSYYRFAAPIYFTSGTSQGLAIINDSGTHESSGAYTIEGQVKNNGSQLSTSVMVGGTLYNGSGVAVGCEHSTETINLNPGQTSDFTINFSEYWRNYNDVVYYRLRVAGELP